MGASMVGSCAAAAGTAGVTSSAHEVTPAVPAGSGGGTRRRRRAAAASRGGGRQHKRPRTGRRKRRVARDCRVSKLQQQGNEPVEDTRESPSPCQNRRFSFASDRPKRVGLDLKFRFLGQILTVANPFGSPFGFWVNRCSNRDMS
jgi:hypothetical protein